MLQSIRTRVRRGWHKINGLSKEVLEPDPRTECRLLSAETLGLEAIPGGKILPTGRQEHASPRALHPSSLALQSLVHAGLGHVELGWEAQADRTDVSTTNYLYSSSRL